MDTRTKKTVKISVLFLSLILFLLAVGCTEIEEKETADKKVLQIYSMSTALGSISNDNLDQQLLTYTIYITNEDETEDYIQWIEPILGEGIKDKVLTDNLKINVEETISPKGSLEVKGQITFDTLGLSKEEIINLEPFITGIRIGGEEVIVINTPAVGK